MKSLGLILLALSPMMGGTLTAVEEARKFYDQTAYEESLKILLSTPSKDPDTLLLFAKDYYRLNDFKKAQVALEQVVAFAPGNSNYHLWLGRALGRRAQSSSPLLAPRYAVKARQHFEKAVQLDPANIEALDDLFEYYLDAPGFLGGGYDKAETLATRIAIVEAAEGHYARYRLAEKRKRFDEAERELRLAAHEAPLQVGRLIDLAKFLADQGHWAESDAVFQSAQRIAPDDHRLLFERAATYIRSKRNLSSARELLKAYLSAQLTPEDPPRHAAEELLKGRMGL